MCLVQPRIDLASRTLMLTAKGHPDLVLPLHAEGLLMTNICQAKVCSERCGSVATLCVCVCVSVCVYVCVCVWLFHSP